MKKILVLAFLVLVLAVTQNAMAQAPAAATTVIVHEEPATSFKTRRTWGVGGMGFFEISDYESIYVNFPASGFQAAGAGVHSFFEIGAQENFTLSFTVGYSRVLYTNKFDNIINRDFFVADILGHYYFGDMTDRIQPYVAGGVGVNISSGSAVPLADVGGGAHFMLTDNFSIRLQLLYKTAIVHNRGEGSFDIAYHF